MSIRLSRGIVVPNAAETAVCVIPIRENGTQVVRISAVTCCYEKIGPCIAQGADKTFQFVGSVDEDYSDATAITFDVWQGGIAGTSLIAKTLSDFTVPNDYTLQVSISDTESAALPKGRHHSEVWVTLATGERRLVGMGPFLVEDTRKND